MTTVDYRTRFKGDTTVIEPEWLFTELPQMLSDTSELAARGVAMLGLSPLSLDVGDATAHLLVDQGGLAVREGVAPDGPLVTLGAAALSDLVQDVTSTFGLVLAGRLEMRRGASDDFVAWEPVLRAVLDGRPVYEPGTMTFCASDGADLDLERSFTLDDSPDEIGHFLAEAGFLHLRGVFTEDEMAAVSADLDDAIAAAHQDDGASWWARTEDEGWYASRILGFNLQSSALRDLLSSDRFQSIGRLTDDETVQRDPHAGDSAEGLHKKVGVVEGISDVSWHKDCSLGDHSRRCCGLTTGISVTGADVGSGELGVIAGSNRANVQQIDLHPYLDLPRIPLPTQTGDVTVHCSCTLHMSRPPTTRERRVVYTGFDLAPRPGDVIETLGADEIRNARHALSDQVRAQQGSETFDPENSERFALPERR